MKVNLLKNEARIALSRIKKDYNTKLPIKSAFIEDDAGEFFDATWYWDSTFEMYQIRLTRRY